jgi:hypothetical protein
VSKVPKSKEGILDFSLSYNSSIPKSAGISQLQTVKLKNLSAKTQNMLIVNLTVPSCMEVDIKQLEVYKTIRVISEYRLSGSSLQVVIEKIDSNHSLSFNVTRKTVYSGQCHDVPAEAFYFYNGEHVWA